MAMAAEVRRIARELDAMHELVKALMAEIQALKEQKRGRPPKDTNGN